MWQGAGHIQVPSRSNFSIERESVSGCIRWQSISVLLPATATTVVGRHSRHQAHRVRADNAIGIGYELARRQIWTRKD